MQHVHISADHPFFDLKFDELRQYKGLILMFTRRNFSVRYRQTILGPIWLFIRPLFTSCIFSFLFGNIANISTDGIPRILFYLTGNTLWTYFASCISRNASSFTSNAALWGKVYFPRLVIPISNVLISMIQLSIESITALLLLLYYTAQGSVTPAWNYLPFLPFIILQLGMMGMGTGLIISSVTAKYRDLSVLVSFGLQVWMYATPVVYPLNAVPAEIKRLLVFNPVTVQMELYRATLLGSGNISYPGILYSWIITILVFFFGVLVFNRTERTFADIV